MTAVTFCPQASDRSPTIARSLTCGRDNNSRSISRANTFSPPVLMISAFRRPWIKYAGLRAHDLDFPSPEPGTRRRMAISPVLNHPSCVNSFFVASGKERQGKIQLRRQSNFKGYWRNPDTVSISSPYFMRFSVLFVSSVSQSRTSTPGSGHPTLFSTRSTSSRPHESAMPTSVIP